MHFIVKRNMWSVWRTVLEENEKLAKARLAAVEVFQQQIADDIKLLRSHKVQTSRKVSSYWNFRKVNVLMLYYVIPICRSISARNNYV